MDTSLIVSKFVLMADVVVIIVLANVIEMICSRCYCHLSMLIGTTVVDVMTKCIEKIISNRMGNLIYILILCLCNAY